MGRLYYTCPNDSNVCHYQVQTGSTPKVGLGGEGYTAHKDEYITAPDDNYFTNAHLSGQFGGVWGLR